MTDATTSPLIAILSYHRHMTIDSVSGDPVDESLQLEDRSVYAALFHALAEPTRLAILEHLGSGEHRVRDVVDHMHLAQSTVSKHLACLRDCGLVTVRIEGRASWFSLADPTRLEALIESAAALLSASGTTLSLREHRDLHDRDAAQWTETVMRVPQLSQPSTSRGKV
jgi:DNA-binding transcriptional ArsR family regulator|uniref:ArsR/SmtB family transcription factor n=2 Tax=Dietziaceae TaxID=85029 RepID=UPI003D812422